VTVDVSRETFRATLDVALEEMKLPLPSGVRERSVALYLLLVEWNRVHNLTRIVSAEEAAWRHFAESWAPLMVAGLFDGVVSAADIGSGAGFPGLPLALALPDIRWTLVEKASKKAAFLTYATATLGLTNITVRSVDARTLSDRFDLVTFRALTSDEHFLEDLASLRSTGGRLLLFLGPDQPVSAAFSDEEHLCSLRGFPFRLVVSPRR